MRRTGLCLFSRIVRDCFFILAILPSFLSSVLNGQEVVINEIYLDPPDRTRLEEFVELHNPSDADFDLSGCFFSNGITFQFPDGATLPARGYVVVAEDTADFEAAFGFAPDFGPFDGRFDNVGERVTLRAANGTELDEVNYQVGFPWPIGSGGSGSSMELLHPGLDNNLGGSWRASGVEESEAVDPIVLLAPQEDDWSYRKGTSEASNPRGAWREPGFVEDGTWDTGQTSVGYGDGDDNTELGDMRNNYSTVFMRRVFHVDDPDEIPNNLKLRVYADDGAIVWINGTEYGRVSVPGGALAYDDFGNNHEASWEEFDLPRPSTFLNPGDNIIAVQGFNATIGSSDFSLDASILFPGSDVEIFGEPSPNERNSIYTEDAPPQIRQVDHLPRQPLANDDIPVTCKVTDPHGVASVTLLYQICRAGQYISAHLAHPHSVLLSDPNRPFERNPEFDDPSNWTELPMVDDGGAIDALRDDDIYTGLIPGQPNRTLVRYRIRVTDTNGNSVTVPYIDDPSLNFALFVYNGVPSYTASSLSVQPGGAPYTYTAEQMSALPNYILITRNSDVAHCMAYSGNTIPKSNEDARDRFNWEGCFVYEGFVYDHVRFRLRQANDRYGGSGKRSMRIRFRKANYLRVRDRYGNRYPTRWRTLNSGKMFDNKDVGNFGLTEQLNHDLWNRTMGAAPFVHTFVLRIVDGASEGSQYSGDFWGMHVAFEDYDARYLDSHGLEDGSLYKLKDQQFNGLEVKRHQGRYAVTTDADFQNIRNNLRPERNDQWLRDHVNYDRWYRYHAIVEGIRHYDFRPADSHLKNRAWYFEPNDTQYGRMWTMPWDSDASWGPNWNSGVDYSKNAIFGRSGKPAFKQEYRNVIREVRDLLWTQEVLHSMIDDLAAERFHIARADRDRFRNAPSNEGRQDFGTMERKVTDMKGFAFTGWSGGSGPTVPAGGRARHLDNLANAEGDSNTIPRTPSVQYIGPAGYPADMLSFRSSSFSDPQGSGTFGAMKWRIGEVTDEDTPGYDPEAPLYYEYDAIWESDEIRSFESDVLIPALVSVGHRYRVRVKMRDTTNKWSHWSAPHEFTIGEPTQPFPPQSFLRVTELMFNPAGGSDFEFLELQNTGPTTLDLRSVTFGDGIEFSFAGSDIEELGPGEFVLLVNNRVGFEQRYDTRDLNIAGQYGGRLANGGETISLRIGGNIVIQSFTYDDLWYVQADGIGHSLEIIDPAAPVDTWNNAISWQPSAEIGGSPGLPASGVPPTGGYRVPSDANGDSLIDVSDAVSLVFALFLGGDSLPCEGDEIEGTGNEILLDANGDDGVDISDALYVLNFLFGDGPGPALGFECVRIEGCSTVCSN